MHILLDWHSRSLFIHFNLIISLLSWISLTSSLQDFTFICILRQQTAQAGPSSLHKLFFPFFSFFLVPSYVGYVLCTSKWWFGYLLLRLAIWVFVEVFVREWPTEFSPLRKNPLFIERPQISQNILSFGRSQNDLPKLLIHWCCRNTAGLVYLDIKS